MPPGSNLVDFNGGFSYIISSWLTEEGRNLDMVSYITTSCSTSSNIHDGVPFEVIHTAILTYFYLLMV